MVRLENVFLDRNSNIPSKCQAQYDTFGQEASKQIVVNTLYLDWLKVFT